MLALLVQVPVAGAVTPDVLPADVPSAAPQAQHPAAGTVTLPLPVGCDNRPNAIGLSRIVEIDTTGGPRLGHSQYKDLDFLEDGEVVLTFDDGPIRRYTKPVLDTLDAHCTRATFFSVGRMAIADPEMLKETARRGHTIASHTWSHPKFSKLTEAKAKYEIELGNSAVTRALGQPIASFFRFPYLRDTKPALAYLRGRNFSTFSIEVDSQDYRTHNPGQVMRNVMSQLKVVKKGIILFHDIQPATAGALSSILDNLKAGGFRVVHLISKYPSTTLPEYDAVAEREIERHRLGVSGQVAAGSISAPVLAHVPPVAIPGAKSNDAFVKPGQIPAVAGAALPRDGVGASPPAAGEVQAPSAPVPNPPQRTVRKPLWEGLDEDPWRIKVFGD